MKLKIINEKEMPLLDRKVVSLELDYEGTATPKKTDITKQLIPLLKTKESLLKIKKVFPHYGEDKAKVKAYVYKNESSLKEFEKVEEKKVEEKKESPKEEPKKEEKPKEQPKQVKESGKEESKEQSK